MSWGKWLSAHPSSPTEDPPLPCPGRRLPRRNSRGQDRRPVTAAGAAEAGLRGRRQAPERPGRAAEGALPRAAEATDSLRRVCSAEFAGERQAGSRGAATGCGATSRGNRAGSAAPRVPESRLRGVALVPPVRAISLNNARTPPEIPVVAAT